MTPFASVAMLEELALLKIALQGPRLQQSFRCNTSPLASVA
jgi:hypothetical protein